MSPTQPLSGRVAVLVILSAFLIALITLDRVTHGKSVAMRVIAGFAVIWLFVLVNLLRTLRRNKQN